MQQLHYLLQCLVEFKWLKYHQSGVYTVLPAGWERCETTEGIAAFQQAFVAMWFQDDMLSAWTEGFKPAIEQVGWLPMRIDAKEHINKICDEIILEIRRSRFVVADLTGGRGGVYYEAGFAAGLGIPVILTCKNNETLHFDIRQYNCIFWESESELQERLKNRIGRVIGHGPLQ